MSFIPLGGLPAKRLIPGVGPKNAKIAIVGEAPGAYEDAQLKPFVGPAGSVLEQCLHAAGLIRSEVYLTNVIKERPKGSDVSAFFVSTGRKFSFTALGMKYVQQLYDELDELNPNIIVTCGQVATAALTGIAKVMKYRGYLFESQGLKRITKVLPTIHPSSALRGMYIYRYLIAADLKKAKEFSVDPDLIRPERNLAIGFTHLNEALDWCEYMRGADMLSIDIEVTNYALACIGFASSPTVGCSIPFDDRWTLEEEVELIRAVQRVVGTDAPKIFQNGLFDTHFLATECGIVVRGKLEDTMIAHSVCYPEFPKGLGFLGSLHCGSQAYWKDKVDFHSIKQED